MYYLYKFTNPNNLKSYIGVTDNLERRYREHKKKERINSNNKFTCAIQKYGLETFIFEHIATCQTEEDAKTLEIELIKQYDSYNNGYNSTIGGDYSNSSSSLTEEEVDEIRRLLEKNELLQIEIARLFEVGSTTISDIANNRRWSYMKTARKINRTRGQLKGTQNTQSKLTESDVIYIKTELMKGTSRSLLQKQFNLTKNAIREVAVENTWKHVVVPGYVYVEKELNGNAKLNPEIVQLIKQDLQTATSINQLSKKYNISRMTIANIRDGKIWKDVK